MGIEMQNMRPTKKNYKGENRANEVSSIYSNQIK